MNTEQTAQGDRQRPGWLSKIEGYANRAADALMRRAESVAKDVKERTRFVTTRRARKSADAPRR